MAENPLFAQIIAHCKEYGFVYGSSDIYDGLGAVYDFGPCGAQLKKNLRDRWWHEMCSLQDNIVGIDSAIFVHPTVWQASGHLANFSDPLVDNKTSKKRYRVDQLIEQHAQTLDTERAKKMIAQAQLLLDTEDFVAVDRFLQDEDIRCEVSGTKDWTPVRKFNLMFATKLGSLEEQGNDLYLRPETAQGIFVNFLNVHKTTRMKIPFGIAQTGKAFRNEIVARQFIFRMREFEQMEMQFFIPPGTQQKWFDYWKQKRWDWLQKLGLKPAFLRVHPHTQLAHYADSAVDIEFQFPFGYKELEGIHSRTDFDLKQHEIYSKKKIRYFDTTLNKSYIPYVIETSIGLDRLFLAMLCQSYEKQPLTQNGKTSERVVLHLPPSLAPYQLAVLPLVKKDNLPDMGRRIYEQCRKKYSTHYDDNHSIGKRYRRHDAMGTPFCCTIDHDSLQDETVTIRERDSMTQTRMNISQLDTYLQEHFS